MTLKTLLENMHFGFDDWSKWFWMFVGIAIAGLLGWFVRGVLGFGARPSVEVGRPAKVAESVELRGDQLEAVEGIGPTYAALLRRHDVHRFEQLAATDVVTLQVWLKELGAASGLARPLSWPIQAALLANGQYEDFAKVVSLLKVGFVTPAVLPGIGETTQTQLAEADVSSIESLAAITAAELVGRLAKAGHSVSAKQAQGWIDAAMAMLAGSTAPLLAHLGIAPETLVTRYIGEPLGNATRSVEGGLESQLFAVDAKGFAGFRTGPWWPLLLTGLGGMIAMVVLCVVFEKVCPEKCPRQPTCEEMGCRITVTYPTVVPLGFNTDTLFESNKAELKNGAEADISRKYQDFLPKLGSNGKVQYVLVLGHADVRASEGYNRDLSQRRAQTLANAIRQFNLPGTPKFGVYGLGEIDPRSDPVAVKAGNAAKTPSERAKWAKALEPDRWAEVHLVLESVTPVDGSALSSESSTPSIAAANR